MKRPEIERIVLEYMAGENKLGFGKTKSVFVNRSYSKWACKEIFSRLRMNPDARPIEVIEKFALQMGIYAVQSNPSSYIFSIAYDTAQDILDAIDIYERT